MPENNIHILSTRPVDPSLVESAVAKGITVHQLSFIETSPVTSAGVITKIEKLFRVPQTVIFTSMNAVEMVGGLLNEKVPPWKIYCIGNTTRHLIIKYFGGGSICGTADNASALGDVMIGDGITGEVSFFCGDHRRDELPDLLRNKNIAVNETIVYNTIPLSQRVSQHYAGILFFSPSGVFSFFSVNEIAPDVILFAIGTTTAEALRSYSSNTIIVADSPGKNNLVEQMISYFTSKANDRIKE